MILNIVIYMLFPWHIPIDLSISVLIANTTPFSSSLPFVS
jgi:hypothetical protein